MAADKNAEGSDTSAPNLDVISARIAQTQRDLARSIESIRHETSAPVIRAKAKSKASQTAINLIFIDGTTAEGLKTHSIMDGIKSVRPQIVIGVAVFIGINVGVAILGNVLKGDQS